MIGTTFIEDCTPGADTFEQTHRSTRPIFFLNIFLHITVSPLITFAQDIFMYRAFCTYIFSYIYL